MIRPAREFLTDFGGTGVRPAQPAAGSARMPLTATSEQLQREAYERGLREGAVRAAEEARLAAADAARQAAETLEAHRRAWAAGEASRLSRDLLSGLADLEARIGHGLIEALAPFAEQHVRAAVVAAAREELRRLGRDRERRLAHLTISGPNDLVDALLEEAGALGLAVDRGSSEVPELRIDADGAVLQSQLAKWMQPFAASAE